MLEFHEGQSCDAILCELERRTGETRSNVWSPEEKRIGEPVELAFKLGETLFVMEHTGIEPFEGHMQLEAQAELHFGPIKAALEGVLPADVIELELPAKAMQELRKAEIEKAQRALVEWIKDTAPKLPVRRYSDYIGAEKPITLADVPFVVRLFRFEAIAGARFQVKHLVGPDRENERSERISRACAKKFPKLADWKKREGARTVLVLEDNDIQLTNPSVVTEAFLAALKGRDDFPDETYLVASCMDPWYAWPILVDGRSYFDLAVAESGAGWSIDQNALEEITARK